ALTTKPAGLSAIAVMGVKSLTMSNDAVLFWMRSMVCASEITTPMVVPSGAARLSMFMPIDPDAPAWFSTTTGWRKLSLSLCPISRALMSPAPPGGLGTMMRTGRGGMSCAAAADGSSASASRRETRGFHMSRAFRRRTPSVFDVPLARCRHAVTLLGGLLERPFAVAQPRHEALLVQAMELERDLAAVVAAECVH